MPTIRNPRPDDLAAIMTIERASFDPQIVENEMVFQKRIEHFPSGLFLVEIEDYDLPIAYISCEIQEFQAIPQPGQLRVGHDISHVHAAQGSEMYISSMGLLPRWRGQGIGGFMLDHALQAMPARFPQINSALLIVSQAWQTAQAMYRQRGFKEIDRYPDFLSLNDPHASTAIVMRRPLPFTKT